MLTPRNHPLKFLLYFEWILLTIALIAELSIGGVRWVPREPFLNMLCIVMVGLLGLRIPTQQVGAKVGYLLLNAGLIVLSSLLSGLQFFPLLFVIFVIRCCLIFESKYHLAIISTTFLTAFSIQIYRLLIFLPFRYTNFSIAARPRPLVATRIPEFAISRLWLISMSGIVLLGLALVFLSPMISAVLAERKSREELAIAHEQLRKYALKIEDVATLQERNRIAREIHDSLGHTLTAFNLHLEAAIRLLDSDPQEAKDLLLEAKQLSAKTLQDVRSSVSTLRSDPLKNQPLAALLQELMEGFQRSTQILPKIEVTLPHDLPYPLKTSTYRIIQEALTNIQKYANATTVQIDVVLQDRLVVKIQDNGRGFVRSQTTSGFGLKGMEERVSALGGTLDILTAPGQGCQITATFPWPPT
ncbi:sensor histidine kinase [Alkalinema sp. FACHB-956]|uniref:sensor histidine kinase n=1 Tax=Alkalinema sp. FACHB-956 TaxID=2692768 RepID=UPI001689B6C4|nr:sensor histidine kinase [Alkalinema sp. FACHB-956]MBD2327054.1 sensor histidine kinase [Alkalinema sp. FACHB-956]